MLTDIPNDMPTHEDKIKERGSKMIKTDTDVLIIFYYIY